MANLRSTNLILQMAPIPATFRGNPNALAAEMVKRMRIVSPNGTNFIFIGDTEPTSNVGPWLKDGTKWYVWDSEINRYGPLDVSDSITPAFWMRSSTPPSTPPSVWLRTTSDPTDQNASAGDPIGWYVFNGTEWVPYVSIVLSGPTASRPANPIEYQQYYDTDISVLIWWERNLWRTVSGVPNDIKFVASQVLTEALVKNPGWAVFGENNQSYRGRTIMQAAKDSGPTPQTVLTVGPNVAVRAAFETFGEDFGVANNPASPVPYPPSIALWALVKL